MSVKARTSEHKRAWKKIRHIVKIGCGRVGVVIAKEEQKKTGSLVLEGKRPLVLCCKFCCTQALLYGLRNFQLYL